MVVALVVVAIFLELTKMSLWVVGKEEDSSGASGRGRGSRGRAEDKGARRKVVEVVA